MPTKKQVRRRKKERRHEWEEVYVDAEGNVVESPPDEDDAPPATRASTRRPAAKAKPSRAGMRTVEPPSWRRVVKRGLIFAPLMFITVYILAPEDTANWVIAQQTVFLLMIFLPFSYAMDALMYRLWRRRTGQTGTTEKRS